ncbi:lipopolysaccharide biosynthesis protein [Blastococcus sp. Marseille-P5729]|uniref:lipopolysaccharide biosynthesis protein n=1 Tax=Blastococcus sp. Marseille-P5729 TaxID=2086582 RepID=UPI000D0F7FA3|nr:lipopolysaccharide biosynthesis protein [Blastococcus sp. Marseille-P5729]
MTGVARRFGSTALIFLLGTAASRLLGLALLPIYVRMLSPAQYGEYDLWMTLINFAAPIAFFQVWDGIYRYYFDLASPTALVTNGLILMGIGASIFVTISTTLFVAWNAPAPLTLFLYGSSLSIQYFLGYLARAELRNTLFVLSGVVNTLVGACASVALLNWTELGISGIFIGMTVGNAVQIGTIAIVMRPLRMLEWSARDQALQRRLLRFSLPLCLASTAYWLLTGFTRFALVKFDDQTANGLFAVADRFGFAVTLTSTVIVYAWQELVYSEHGEPDSRRRRASFLQWLVAGVLLVGAASTVIVALLFDWVISPNFSRAYALVPMTLLAAVMNTISNLIGVVLMSDLRTATLLVSTTVGAVVNVVLCLVLIPRWGAAGGAVALLIGLTTMTFLRVLEGRRQEVLASLGWPAGCAAVGLVCSIAAYLSRMPSAQFAMAALILVSSCFVATHVHRAMRPPAPGA